MIDEASSRRLDARAATEYLDTGYEDSERTFLAEVEPIPPGTWRAVNLASGAVGPCESYWHPERVQPVLTDATEAGRLFADKLRESVAIHVRSDVPVGSALSGGLDSSAIALLVDALHGDNGHAALHTFTSTFPGHVLDERAYVDAVVLQQGKVQSVMLVTSLGRPVATPERAALAAILAGRMARAAGPGGPVA